MGTKESKETEHSTENAEPERRLSQEMIGRGLQIGKISTMLSLLRSEVNAHKSGEKKEHNWMKTAATLKPESSPRESRRESSAWAKFVFKGGAEGSNEGVDTTALKRTRDLEKKQMQNEDTHFHRTQAVINYDAIEEEDENKPQCNYCRFINRDVVIECRICDRSFHKSCLARRDVGGPLNSLRAISDAETAGWSCIDCENLSEYLPIEIMSDLIERFDSYDPTGNSYMTMREYVTAERCRSSTVTELELRRKFHDYDRDSDGKVTWQEFIMAETVDYLRKLPQHELVQYLKPMEVGRLRSLFRARDKEKAGVITVPAAEDAYRAWLSSLHIPAEEEMRKSEERASGPNHNRLITWERFIRNKALSVLTARPNTRTIRPFLTSMQNLAL